MRTVILFSISLIFILSCQSQEQDKRTNSIIRAYFNAIWGANYEEAESFIFNPSKPIQVDKWETCNDTIRQNRIVAENQLAFKNQHQFLTKKYNQFPNINLIEASEISVNLMDKKLMTGIIRCVVEFSNDNLKDTCYVLVFNGVKATKATISEIKFKTPFAENNIKKICE
jgi:hypothetical protein